MSEGEMGIEFPATCRLRSDGGPVPTFLKLPASKMVDGIIRDLAERSVIGRA